MRPLDALRLGTLLAVLGAAPACSGAGSSAAQRAIVLADKGQTSEAVRLLEAHLREYPEAARERRLVVRLYGALGDLNAARRHAELLASRLGEANPTPWLELGHAHELAHRFDAALALYDRAAAVAPRDAAGPRTGGLRAAMWGELGASEPRLTEAVRRGPADTAAWHALGVVRVKLGDLEGAEQAYSAALAVDPAALDSRVGLATIALIRDRPERVLREYEAILRAHPDFGDAHLGRSWALVRLGRHREALVALEAAARLGANPGALARQRRWVAEQSNSAGTR